MYPALVGVLQEDRQEHHRPYRQRHSGRTNRLQTGVGCARGHWCDGHPQAELEDATHRCRPPSRALRRINADKG